MKNRGGPRYPNMLLVTGVVVGLAGSLLMLWNLGYLPQAALLWPVAVIITGLVFLYLAWPRRKSDRWIIPGMVLTLGGIVFLLMNTVLRSQDLARIWPAFMFITGVSLVPYALRKRGPARTAILVPGLFICLLALLFFPFSLRGAGRELSSFVRQWWPLILVVLGAGLIVSFFSTRRPNKKV